MNTLTGIEAERVVQILKHVSDRLQLLCYVPNTPDESLLDELDNTATIECLQRQWDAEEQLKNLNESAFSDLGGRDIAVIKASHRAVRALTRQLLVDPQSVEVLMNRKSAEERKNLPSLSKFVGKLPPIGQEPQQLSVGPESEASALSNFITYLNDLCFFVHKRLITTVEDEAANRTILQDLTERERDAEEKKVALDSKLKETTEQKAAETFGLDSTLKKLELELQDLKSSNKVEIDLIQVEMGEAIKKAEVDHDLRLRHLHDQVDGLEKQLDDMTRNNRDEETRLRKEKTRAENILNNKIAQYDADMSSKKAAYDELLREFQAEQAEHSELNEYFKRVDLDCAHDQSEQRLLQLVVRREDYALMCLGIVSRIQALFRGFALRNANKAKKGKDKKGKDKKGKGKKK